MKTSTITNFIPEGLSPNLLQYNETSINCKDFSLNDKKGKHRQTSTEMIRTIIIKSVRNPNFFLQDSFATFFGPNESWKKKLVVSNSLGIDGFDVLKLD